ncbi:MAG: ABC transporter permease [Candidatus Omnitrophica bacterium]|nr:ABC transporter permease [Candidatus Omnitrophota bacterium]
MSPARIQWVAFSTIVTKEIRRFTRIWQQTLLPLAITMTLYFVIFGQLIGSRIGQMGGVDYMSFIVPGLIMMSVITNAYANVSSSFFSNKFQRSIEELLVSPTPNWVIIMGYITGGIFRGIVVGFLVFCVSGFFTKPEIHHFGIIVLFVILTSIVFALGGLVNAIFAKKFDDVNIFPVFILTPLTYLGGVFYSIQSLPPIWQNLSKLNPVLYLINGFRYGFYGFSDVDIVFSFLMLVVFMVVLLMISLFLMNKGIGLKE